jgi:hypothetical protein
MRKIVYSLAPVLMAISGSALAQAPAWKVSEVSGDVRVVQDGRPRLAVRGALLSSGSTIATGSNARAVIVRGEEFVVISPRTQLRVPAAASQNSIMQLIADFGTAMFKIQRKSTPHFGVQTPYLAAVVKGTTFTVTVGPEGSSVQVTEGAVQVSTLDGGAAELVRPGGIAMVAKSDLFRLTVQGETNKVIRSEKAPVAGVANGKGGPAPHSAAYSGPPGQEVKIGRAVHEKDKSLSEVTRGLVEGNSSAEMAQAEFREQARAARREGANPGNGDGEGGGKPDDPGKPEKPNDAAKPEDPGKPQDPAKPGDPGKPDGDDKDDTDKGDKSDGDDKDDADKGDKSDRDDKDDADKGDKSDGDDKDDADKGDKSDGDDKDDADKDEKDDADKGDKSDGEDKDDTDEGDKSGGEDKDDFNEGDKKDGDGGR